MITHFSHTFAEARSHFLKLCEASADSLEHLVHPLPGPDGELFTDVALWGSHECSHLLVVSSALHGIEGYAGSGLQSLLLAEGLSQQLPNGTSLMMIHAINPHGFAWQRRVNESNIDLNRNFVDHQQPPLNLAYRDIAGLLEPTTWDESAERQLQGQLAQIADDRGARWLQGALTMGQYEYSNGFFYGGTAPAWSNLLMHSLADRYFRSAHKVTMLDVHTALGDFGTAECITTYPPSSREFKQCQALWGDRVKSTVSDSSVSVDVNGPMVDALQPYTDILGTGLEFGTLEIQEITMALIADQWLHTHGDRKSLKGQAIVQRMMNAFYPDDAGWRESIANITRELVSSSLQRQ